MVPAQEFALSDEDLSFILVKRLRQQGEFRRKHVSDDELADVVQQPAQVIGVIIDP